MKSSILTLFFVYSIAASYAQEHYIKVTAVAGDGVYSLLRKNGVEPTKYAKQFIALNKDLLKNDNELVLGKEYKIPYHMAMVRTVSETETVEKDNLVIPQIVPETNSLKEAIIYLVVNGPITNTNSSENFLMNLSKELMLKGATIVPIGLESQMANSTAMTVEQAMAEDPISNLDNLKAYVDRINENYLKNRGAYQRILVVDLSKVKTSENNVAVTIFHHKKSDVGERFAFHLNEIFVKENKANSTLKYTDTFKNERNLFLARNTLPPVTLIKLETSKDAKSLILREPNILHKLITSGIEKDYSSLSLTN